jgi:hypothetical protein
MADCKGVVGALKVKLTDPNVSAARDFRFPEESTFGAKTYQYGGISLLHAVGRAFGIDRPEQL